MTKKRVLSFIKRARFSIYFIRVPFINKKVLKRKGVSLKQYDRRALKKQKSFKRETKKQFKNGAQKPIIKKITTTFYNV